MSEWPWKGSIPLPVDDQCAWGSWMAPLMACVCATEGAILEIGAGDWSTPFLHHFCACVNRPLRTIESDAPWLEKYADLRSPNHGLIYGDLNTRVREATTERWGVALVDGSPSETRAAQCLMLRDAADYLVVHDFSGKECIETFTPEVMANWPYRVQAPRPRYSPSSLVLGMRPIPEFPGIERL